MLQVGTILHGTYKIESYLASGGFGNTYLTKNIEFDETCHQRVLCKGCVSA